MLIKNSSQLRTLTGAWYASNDFARIETDIQLETEELAKIIGAAVIEKTLAIARSQSPSSAEEKLLALVQLPVALMATYRFYQSNIVSHDQSSRKVKIDPDNEKLPWEWMLDRDDEAHLQKARRATDRLIAHLDQAQLPEWDQSPNKQTARSLFINNTETFGEYYPIDHSPRFYYTALPLIREVQTLRLKPVLDEDYAPLLSAFQAGSLSPYQTELLDRARRAQATATIALAARRLSATILPSGIAKALKSHLHTVNATQPATLSEINHFAKRIEQDTTDHIDSIKRLRHQNRPNEPQYPLIPKNSPRNKFAST